MPELHWQKSSFSSEASNCVELAASPDGTIRLRSNPTGPGDRPHASSLGLHSLLAAARWEISRPALSPAAAGPTVRRRILRARAPGAAALSIDTSEQLHQSVSAFAERRCRRLQLADLLQLGPDNGAGTLAGLFPCGLSAC